MAFSTLMRILIRLGLVDEQPAQRSRCLLRAPALDAVASVRMTLVCG